MCVLDRCAITHLLSPEMIVYHFYHPGLWRRSLNATAPVYTRNIKQEPLRLGERIRARHDSFEPDIRWCDIVRTRRIYTCRNAVLATQPALHSSRLALRALGAYITSKAAVIVHQAYEKNMPALMCDRLAWLSECTIQSMHRYSKQPSQAKVA